MRHTHFRLALCRTLTVGSAVGLLTLASTAQLFAQQIKYTIDPRTSIAWWEVNPNLSHLWATTCPEDPAWQPGEGRSVGFMVDYLRRTKITDSHMSDTNDIPVYPRKVVRSLCTPAVSGEVTATDSTNWRGVRGTIAIKSEHLRTGLDFRDEYARKAIYGSNSYPEIKFQIDSLINVRRGAKDSTFATAVGILEIRGVKSPMTIPVLVRHTAGGIRVQGRTHVPASFLTEKYGISPLALGMSVGLRVWKDLWMGVDVVLRPQAASS